jgi:hypothetical protein
MLLPGWEVNWLAVLVAAAATFAIGALWYSPLLFAKPWMRAHGYTTERLEQMRKSAGRSYAVSFVSYVVMGVVFSILLSLTGASSAVAGAWVGFLVWLGFAFTIGLTRNAFSDEAFAAFAIDVGYQLVYLLVMGSILGGWR